MEGARPSLSIGGALSRCSHGLGLMTVTSSLMVVSLPDPESTSHPELKCVLQTINDSIKVHSQQAPQKPMEVRNCVVCIRARKPRS